MEADGAVAEHREHRRLGLGEPRRDCERQRAADRAGDAVDHAPAHRQHALAPLGELAAVADQHRVGIALDIGAQRAEHLRRMQAAGRLRRDGRPRGGAVVERGARLREPAAVARLRRRRHARSAFRRRRARPRCCRARAGRPFPCRRARPARPRDRSRSAAPPGRTTSRLAQRVVKSSALPSSTIRSARRTRSENAPSVASAMPRGLSRITAGAFVAASSRASNARPLTLESCGPAKMIGRAAAAIAASVASATAVGERRRRRGRASGQTIALLSTRSSEQVRRQAQMHRPGPARCRDADRLADIAPERRGRGRGERGLGDRRRHVGLADFLEAAAPELPGRRMARQQHHRRLRAERRVERADRVGVARPAGHHRDAGLAR